MARRVSKPARNQLRLAGTEHLEAAERFADAGGYCLPDAAGDREALLLDQLTEEQRAALATEALIVGAKMARDHLSEFFSFVMVHEMTQEPLMCAAHQRVVFSFVQRFKHCVVRMPVGASKTFCMAALTLYFLGHDATERGAIISATQGQAAKPLKMVADYITQPQLNAALRLVFPNLRKSPRKRDPWTQTALTIDRPPGIRDPSLVALGVDGQLPGARLSWAVVDDILDRENTATPAGRFKVFDFFDSTVLSRMDPDGRVVVTNTPWHPDDITYRLERAGWPTLTMGATGEITLSNVPEDWDTDDIRPSIQPGDVCRLTEHDPDPDEAKSLWDEKYAPDILQQKRDGHLAHRFNQLFLCLCRSDEDARCKREWIEHCKRHDLRLVSRYNGSNLTVTGVDLAVGQGASHDFTAFVTLELLPTGKRRVLDVEVGRFDGPTIVDKVIAKATNYNSIVRVENNAAQDYILQFARAKHASVPVKAHTTGRSKAHPEFGVEGLFVELKNKAWEFPCPAGHVHKHLQQLFDDCLYYEPGKHTGDVLMAAWLAQTQARKLGDGRSVRQSAGQARFTNLMAR